MGARRADADTRRFFDEFEKVRVSRFRAMGVIDPMKRDALIPFPNGKMKLIGVKHTALANGGGWSYFVCPKCARRTTVLYLIDDAPLCCRCCEALNIRHASKYGFGRETRRKASDQHLDQLIAKLETEQPLKLKPERWDGNLIVVRRIRALTKSMRRSMVKLRLNQLASQQAKDSGGLKLTRAFRPHKGALAVIPELQRIWRANSHERLQQALDKAQISILKALDSKDLRQAQIAASLMLKTKQARDRGIT